MPEYLSLQQYLLRAAALLLVTGLYGFLLAASARLFGDEGVKQDGRLTPNPLVHLDLVGLAAAILYLPGWMKPMRIDHDQLKGGRWSLILCVLLATLATCAVAVLVQLIKPLISANVAGSVGLTANLLVTVFGRVAIWFSLVNLIPIFPFAGGHILAAVLPRAGKWLEKNLLWPTIAAAALIASGLAMTVLRPLYQFVARFGVGL